MKRSGAKMEKPHKVRLSDLNFNILCSLCGGYFIDATTITECMHSFCKTCIIKYLGTNKYCPTCDVQVYKENPSENLRADETLQDIVYKIVPGLFKNEMQARREFYKQSEATPTSVEDAGEDTSHLYTPDDAVSLSLSYFSIPPNPAERRFFCCPAAVKVFHLAKLMCAKHGLYAKQKVDILFLRDVLNPELTLMEVMHVYAWRRRGPLHLSYRIVDNESKQIKHDVQNGSGDYLPSHLIGTPPPVECKCKPIKAVHDEGETVENMLNYVFEKQPAVVASGGAGEHPKPFLTKEDEWKEVQLQISESGVMSFVNVSRGAGSKDEAVGMREIKSLNAVTFPSIENITVDDSSLSVLTGGGHLIGRSSNQKNEPCLLNNNSNSINNKNNNNNNTNKGSSALVAASQAFFEQERKNKYVSAASKINEQSVNNNNNEKTLDSARINICVEASSTVSRTDGHVQEILLSQATNSCEKSTVSRTENMTVCVPVLTKPDGFGKNSDVKNKLENPMLLPITSKSNVCATNSVRDVHANVNSAGIAQLSDTHPLLNNVDVSSHTTSNTSKEIPRSFSSLNNTHFPPKHSSSKRDPPKMAIVAPTPSLPLANGGAKSHLGPHAVGCKPLRLPPRTWNPTIPRLSIPTTKYRSHIGVDTRKCFDGSVTPEHKSAMNSAFDANVGNRVSNFDSVGPLAPPRFFKMRNMPRYLGNPASGVKPMYQVASTVFSEPKQTAVQSPVKKPLPQKVKNSITSASSVANPGRSGETPSTFLPKIATSTSASADLPSNSCAPTLPRLVPTSSSNSSGMFQNAKHSDSGALPNNSTFNFSPVSSSNYVSFADLCKSNAMPVRHLGESMSTSSSEALKNFTLSSVQAGSPPVSHARKLPDLPHQGQSPVGPGAFHLLPPSVDMIFKPQLRLHSSGGSRYQCTTPAVQRVPATSSVTGGPKTHGSALPSVSQIQPDRHAFVASVNHEQKMDTSQVASDAAALNKALSLLPVPNQHFSNESSS
ncbi:probable serine/threonine-protein kinase nek3 [Bacillus rossius redtenbacheri]|uniref:probable serine/threonine-protein kinase nek3 n=1 Tax=Bacillus rossius redtenbacheri TaxID=93214 RepID=UPI002FDDB7B8